MDLIQKLEQRKNAFANIKFKNEEAYEFFTNVSREITINPDLHTIAVSDMLVALMIVDNKDFPFNEIIDTIYDLILTLDYSSVDELNTLLTAIFVLKKEKLIDHVLEYKNKPNGVELNSILKKYEETEDIENDKKLVYASLAAYIRIGIGIFADYYDLRKFTQLIIKFNKIDENFARYINYRENYKIVTLVKECEKHGNVRLELREKQKEEYDIIINTLKLEKILTQIKNYDSEINKERSNFLKQQNKLILTYDKLITWLKTLDNSEITEIPYDTILKIENTELQSELIKKGLENNRSVYLELAISNIKKDKYNVIEKIFYKHNINFKEFDKNERKLILDSSNQENIDEMLDVISSENWYWLKQNKQLFISILLNSSKEIIFNINKLLKSKVITKEFVSSNPEILIDEVKITNLDGNNLECKYKIFNNNLTILRKYFSNFSNILKNNSSLLLEDTKEILKNLQLIENYNLNMESNNATTYNLEILNNSNLFDDLDTFIELGYKDIIVNNPQLLRKNVKQILERLTIAQAINLDVVNSSNRFQGMITNGKNFYIDDTSLDEYRLLPVEEYYEDPNFDILRISKRNFIDDRIKDFEIIMYLEENFKISELEYQFEDVIISRNKVLRNFSALLNSSASTSEDEMLLSSIIYHTVLDNTTIDFIKKSINKCESKKYLKKN